MPTIRTLMDVALGYGARAEDRSGPRYRRPTRTVAYGQHPLQALDLHLLAGQELRPLIAFVHGGAWQFGDKARRLKDLKVPFAHGEGWHFAALNFRLVPEAGVAQMAQDVAAGIARLWESAGEWGIDRRRIVLMGHSSGAQLAALVAADPAYLARHGLTRGDLAGVIANDGAAYDARRPSTRSRLLTNRLVEPAFAGADRTALSPVAHLRAGPGHPPFLILAAGNGRGESQSRLLAEALREAAPGQPGSVELHEFDAPGIRGHVRLSRQFGRPGFGPTEAARRWLRKRLAG